MVTYQIKKLIDSSKKKNKKCPYCHKPMFFDHFAGPIVGGVIMPIADKETGEVRLSGGTHNIGEWVCTNPNCKGKMVFGNINEKE